MQAWYAVSQTSSAVKLQAFKYAEQDRLKIDILISFTNHNKK